MPIFGMYFSLSEREKEEEGERERERDRQKNAIPKKQKNKNGTYGTTTPKPYLRYYKITTGDNVGII